MVRKFVLPIVVSTILAVATSADAAQRTGGGGRARRAIRTVARSRGVRERRRQSVDPTAAGAILAGATTEATAIDPTYGSPHYRGAYPTTIAGIIPTIGRIRITTRVSASDSDSDSRSGIRPSITVIQHSCASACIPQRVSIPEQLETHIRQHRRRSSACLTRPIPDALRAIRDRV